LDVFRLFVVVISDGVQHGGVQCERRRTFGDDEDLVYIIMISFHETAAIVSHRRVSAIKLITIRVIWAHTSVYVRCDV